VRVPDAVQNERMNIPRNNVVTVSALVVRR
jgi:hypothetical protein